MATIGISTCAYLDLPLPRALDRIAALVDAAEVRCAGSHGLRSAEQIRAVALSGLRCSVHAPDEIDIWSADRRVRAAGVAAHQRLLEACAAAGALVYVVHPDYSPAGVDRQATTVAALEESFAALFELAGLYGVQVVVENMPGERNSHFAAPGLDLKGLGLAFDVGHAHASGTLADFFARGRIAHVHLHDNFGSGVDLHLPLGQGGVPREAVRRAIELPGVLAVLEHHNEFDVRASLAYLEGIGCREAILTAV